MSEIGTDLTRRDPWPRRFAAWVAERFPPVQGVLFFALYALALLAGRALAGPGRLEVGPRDLVGFLGFYAFFLMLRIFDEHKDYELDCRNHPHRVLQRGLIGLGDLKVVCAAAIALQGGVSLWLDGGWGPITRIWLVLMAASWLMAAEFFAGRYLKPRIMLYAASHMLVMPIVVAWAAAIGAAGVPLPALAFLGALAYFSGFVFEIGRKIRAPEDERDTVDSYSKVLGPRGASRLMIALLAVVHLLLAMFASRAVGRSGELFVLTALAGLLLAGSVAALRFSAGPTPRRAKRLEAVSAGTVLAGYLIVIGILAAGRGLVWS